MDRLTKKLKKGGYSANKHSEEEIAARLEQLRGVHLAWIEQANEMVEGMGQASAAGPDGGLSLTMLQAGYNSLVRIGRRFEDACPPENNEDTPLVSLGRLEDLYEACVMEQDDIRAGLDECKENGYSDSMAYNELLNSKIGNTELIKRFDIATGFLEEEEAEKPAAPTPKETKPD